MAVPEGRGKKARKREAKHKTGAKSGGSATFAEPELDLAAERERVKVGPPLFFSPAGSCLWTERDVVEWEMLACCEDVCSNGYAA